MRNPYVLADVRSARARARDEGPWRFVRGLLPWLGTLAALPLLRGSIYGFLGASPAAETLGASGASVRVGLLLAGAMALDTFGQALRGPDRGVVDVHPLRPQAWFSSLVRRSVRARVSWLGLGLLALAPLAERPVLLALSASVVAGGWLSGWGVGLGVNLSAAALAERPQLAGLLDAVRGPNPRAHAALLYAPGVSLGVSGASVVTASVGLERIAGGMVSPLSVALLLSPVVAALGGLALGRAYAQARVTLPALLGEIEALHAAAETPEDARLVYLEWVVPRLPAGWRPLVLLDLRQLWRAQRAWVSGGWALGALSALAAWSDAPVGASARAVGCASVALLGLSASRLAAGNPSWLDESLPSPARTPARAVVVGATMLPVLALAPLAAAVRHGLGASVGMLGVLFAVGTACAALASVTATRWRGRGAGAYAAAAMIVVAGGAA
jgi:hypothetical protein